MLPARILPSRGSTQTARAHARLMAGFPRDGRRLRATAPRHGQLGLCVRASQGRLPPGWPVHTRVRCLSRAAPSPPGQLRAGSPCESPLPGPGTITRMCGGAEGRRAAARAHQSRRWQKRCFRSRGQGLRGEDCSSPAGGTAGGAGARAGAGGGCSRAGGPLRSRGVRGEPHPPCLSSSRLFCRDLQDDSLCPCPFLLRFGPQLPSFLPRRLTPVPRAGLFWRQTRLLSEFSLPPTSLSSRASFRSPFLQSRHRLRTSRQKPPSGPM